MENINIIETWIKTVIVGLNLCPFARKPLNENKIRINICEEDSDEQMFQAVIDEIEYLNKYSSTETTVIGFPNSLKAFRSFYSFSLDIQEALEDVNLSKDFQIVAFHPDFVFEGVKENERVNNVNRSPLPLIHILRSKSIENLNLSESEGVEISQRNELLLNEMNDHQFTQLFNFKKNK